MLCRRARAPAQCACAHTVCVSVQGERRLLGIPSLGKAGRRRGASSATQSQQPPASPTTLHSAGHCLQQDRWRSCFNRGTGSQIKSGGSHGAWHVAARTRQQHVPVQANACAATSHAVYLGGRGCRTRVVSNPFGSMLQAHTTTKIRTRRWSIQPRTLLGCRAKLLCNHATGWGGPVAQHAAGA